MRAEPPFARRAAQVIGMVLVAVVIGTIVVLAADLFPLLFGAVLLAVLLRGLSDALSRRTGLRDKSALGVVIAVVLALGGVAGWLMVPSLLQQASQFARELPNYLERAELLVVEHLGGHSTLERARGAAEGADWWGGLSAALEISYSGAFAILVVVIAGVYLAVDPGAYLHGLLRLLPPKRRGRGAEVLKCVGQTLRRFLVGRVVSMVAVGAITAGLLALVGVPMAGLLGFIAGLLTFVPYAGPIVATLPIALVAATEGTRELAFAVVGYAGVQMIEGFLITPLVQERAVSLPPVITLAAEILMGMIFGVMGVVISVPLAAATIVLVRMVYVESVLEGATSGSAG